MGEPSGEPFSYRAEGSEIVSESALTRLSQIGHRPKPPKKEAVDFVAPQAEIVSGAGDEVRTRDPLLGRQMLYH